MKWARKPNPGGQGAGAEPPGLVSPREVPPLLLAGEVDVGGPIAALMDRDRTWAAAAGGGLWGAGPCRSMAIPTVDRQLPRLGLSLLICEMEHAASPYN